MSGTVRAESLLWAIVLLAAISVAMMAVVLKNQDPARAMQQITTTGQVDGNEVSVTTERGASESLLDWKGRHLNAVEEAGL